MHSFKLLLEIFPSVPKDTMVTVTDFGTVSTI